MSKILVKAEPTLSNKILIRKEIAVQQLVGQGLKKPTFGQFARNAFARPGQGVTGGQRLRGLLGMAGKGAAAAVTAQQSAEALQGGNLGAPLQAGITYQGMDPTATIDPNVSEKINPDAKSIFSGKEPVAVQTPAPVPNNDGPKIGVQEPDYSNMPPRNRPIEGFPVPDNTGGGKYSPNVAVTTPPAPAPVAPAPVATTNPAQTQLPIVPQPSQATAPVTNNPLDTNAMMGVGPQPVQQQPVPQPPVQQPVQQPVQPNIPLPGQEQPASTVNPLPAGSAPPGMGGSNFTGNPYDWQPQQAPAQQAPSQYSLADAQAAFAPQMPTGQAQSVLGGMPPQGVAGPANEMTEGGTPKPEELQRQGMSNQFKPLERWDDTEVKASLFTGAIYDKLGPDMVYKMTPHQIGTLSAYMYLKLS